MVHTDHVTWILVSDWSIFQCEELHLVECGARTQLEPAISTTNCPRLWGTFEDPEDCGVFWKCQDGKANRCVTLTSIFSSPLRTLVDFLESK